MVNACINGQCQFGLSGVFEVIEEVNNNTKPPIPQNHLIRAFCNPQNYAFKTSVDRYVREAAVWWRLSKQLDNGIAFFILKLQSEDLNLTQQQEGSYRVCHGFRLTKRDDYSRVSLDHFWSECHFMRQLGQ